MLTLVRRFLVLSVLLFWQGGFLFYASVVVPVAQQVLQAGTTQGFVTRRVTVYMNIAGAVALVPLLWDCLGRGDTSRGRRVLRLLTWLSLAVSVGLLFWLHPRMDAYLDLEMNLMEDYRSFRPLHRWYLWISTIQWALGLVYMILMLKAWREEDRRGFERSIT